MRPFVLCAFLLLICILADANEDSEGSSKHSKPGGAALATGAKRKSAAKGKAAKPATATKGKLSANATQDSKQTKSGSKNPPENKARYVPSQARYMAPQARYIAAAKSRSATQVRAAASSTAQERSAKARSVVLPAQSRAVAQGRSMSSRGRYSSKSRHGKGRGSVDFGDADDEYSSRHSVETWPKKHSKLGAASTPSYIDPSKWKCQGKDINGIEGLEPVMKICDERAVTCRNMCVLQKMGIITEDFQFDDGSAREAIDKILDGNPAEAVYRKMKACASKVKNNDQDLQCEGNKAFAECVHKAIESACKVPGNSFGFKKMGVKPEARYWVIGSPAFTSYFGYPYPYEMYPYWG